MSAGLACRPGGFFISRAEGATPRFVAEMNAHEGFFFRNIKKIFQKCLE